MAVTSQTYKVSRALSRALGFVLAASIIFFIITTTLVLMGKITWTIPSIFIAISFLNVLGMRQLLLARHRREVLTSEELHFAPSVPESSVQQPSRDSATEIHEFIKNLEQEKSVQTSVKSSLPLEKKVRDVFAADDLQTPVFDLEATPSLIADEAVAPLITTSEVSSPLPFLPTSPDVSKKAGGWEPVEVPAPLYAHGAKASRPAPEPLQIGQPSLQDLQQKPTSAPEHVQAVTLDDVLRRRRAS